MLRMLLAKLFLLVFATVLVAQEATPDPATEFNTPAYSSRLAGDNLLSGGANLQLPLFNIDVSKDSNSFTRSTNMTLGLGLFFNIAYFLSNTFYLGAGLSIQGIADRSEQVLWMFNLETLAGFEFPIYANSLTPLFLVPLTLHASLSVASYRDVTTALPALRPGTGLFYVLPEAADWAIGLGLEYWLLFDLPGGRDDRIANHLRLALGFRHYSY